MLVYCGQTAGHIKIKLGTQVGLGPGHIVLQLPPTQKNGHNLPQFVAHVRCSQTTGWIKMPRGMEEGLGPGDFILGGDPAPHPQKKQELIRRWDSERELFTTTSHM